MSTYPTILVVRGGGGGKGGDGACQHVLTCVKLHVVAQPWPCRASSAVHRPSHHRLENGPQRPFCGLLSCTRCRCWKRGRGWPDALSSVALALIVVPSTADNARTVTKGRATATRVRQRPPPPSVPLPFMLAPD
eukprot:357308-Chlamydomonas_euryale.AAC.3